jgi:hypothetical protein
VAGEGVLALLAAIGGERGCLLVLEDLHWADPDTLDVAAYLAGAVSGTPVLLALTARDDVVLPGAARSPPSRASPASVCGRWTAPGSPRWRPPAGRAPPAGAELRELVARSDGLPFLVEGMLGAASSQVPPTLAGLRGRRPARAGLRSRPACGRAGSPGARPRCWRWWSPG